MTSAKSPPPRARAACNPCYSGSMLAWQAQAVRYQHHELQVAEIGHERYLSLAITLVSKAVTDIGCHENHCFALFACRRMSQHKFCVRCTRECAFNTKIVFDAYATATCCSAAVCGHYCRHAIMPCHKI